MYELLRTIHLIAVSPCLILAGGFTLVPGRYLYDVFLSESG